MHICDGYLRNVKLTDIKQKNKPTSQMTKTSHMHTECYYNTNQCVNIELYASPVPVDPYVAAEEFLETNHLPAYYLDQVAEFIVKNAGEFQGTLAAEGGDPFTGRCAQSAGSLAEMCAIVLII